MSDAIRIEQRLHDLEHRLHDIVAGWGRRDGRAKSSEDTPREMERQVVERLFNDRRGTQVPGFRHDVVTAREMEREAIEHLYGGRSTVVVRVEDETRNGS
jgi:hypothetical protein